MKALVIGGTGPTGYAIVEELLRRDYEVTIYHRGEHELEFSGPVSHLHGNPTTQEDLERDLKGKRFDVAVSTSGRLRYVAKVLAGQVKKLVAVTGEAACPELF